MKKKITMYAIALLASTQLTAQPEQQNYIRTIRYLDTQGVASVTQVRFYDGLGRPSVEATNETDSSGTFAYSQTTYDQSGRQYREWLPVVGGTSIVFPSSIASLSQSTYADGHAYSETGYDCLDRITAIIRPGDAWHVNDKKLTISYGWNGSGEVKSYSATGQTGSLMEFGYEAEGQLERVWHYDEDLRNTIEYSDLLGNVILKRQEQYSDQIDTYYVYNEYGQLRYVLQPMFQQDDDLDAYAYQYAYNVKGLCSMKKLPGCEPVYYWYDSTTNRLAFMQDGNMRSKGRYRFMLYDAFGRIAVQGLCALSAIPERIDAQAVLYANSGGIAQTGYVKTGNGSLQNVTLENAFYYDRYDFRQRITSQAARTSLTGPDLGKKPGMMTGSAVLGVDGEILFTAIYYDEKGREIDKRRMMPDGDILRVTSTYTFTDKPATVCEHLTHGTNTHELAYTYSYYQSSDRLSDVTLSYNGGLPVTVAHYGYDGLGRVSRRQQGGSASTTDYTYNLQGNPKTIQGSAFSQWLYYEDSSHVPSYTGNIASMEWQYAGVQGTYEYAFTYDMAGRLTDTYDLSHGTQDYLHFDEHTSYDANGNILTMRRNGVQDNGIWDETDSLHYSYSGNQLIKVHDGVTGPCSTSAFHFVDNSDEALEYEYDPNGNMTKDLNKKISSIEYNSLNLPTKINMDMLITYGYNSDGEKVKAKYRWLKYPVNPHPGVLLSIGGQGVSPQGGMPPFIPIDPPPTSPYTYDSIEYRGSFVYHNGTLEQALFDGGYITIGSQGTPRYHFYQRDHLGSVRAVVGDDGTVEHTNAYYPFGALYRKDATSDLQRYKFCGKELDRMDGLNLLDFGARWYDPLLGRFTTIDPMAEKYYSNSPYAYCANNPVNTMDPDGRDWISANYSGVHFYFFDSRISSMDDVIKYYYKGEERDSYDIEYKGSEFKMMKQNGEALDLYIFNSNGSYSINGGLVNDEIDTQSLHIGSDITTNKEKININWYGNYLGPKNPVKTISEDIYSYAVPPIDDLDFAAFMHDKGYDKYGAVGATGAFINNKVWKEDLLLAMRSYRSYKQTPSNQTFKRLTAKSTYQLFATLSIIKHRMSKIW